MDLRKFIDDNLDDLINNPELFINEQINPGVPSVSDLQSGNKFINFDELNEDNYLDDDLGELFQNKFDNKFIEKIKPKNSSFSQQPNKKISFGNNQEYIIDKKKEKQLDKSYKSNKSDESYKSNESDESDESDESNESDGDNKIEDYNKLNESDSDEEQEYKQIENEEFENEFYFRLINVFMKYYNEKFDKNENFFTGIKDYNKDTSSQMEIFFEAIFEFKQLKDKILKELENKLVEMVVKENNIIVDDSQIENKINDITLEFIFDENQTEKISYLFEEWSGQIYCIQISKTKFFSPSLIVCLNFILENNLLDKDSWHIFNLRDN